MSRYFDKYVFVAPGSDYGRAMWADLEKNKDCIFHDYPIKTSNIILRLLHHIHFSFGINNRIKLPFQSIWRSLYSLSSVGFNLDEKYCIVLPDVSACRIDEKYLSELSKKKNIELVLVNVNVKKKKERLIAAREKYFSRIFSFDGVDCEKYGYIFHPTIYSYEPIVGQEEINTDAFFIGTYSLERYEKLVSLYKLLMSKGGRPDFNIINVPKFLRKIDGIQYNKKLSYNEVLQKIRSTRCIVEIMNPGQSGLTLRAMEAICYNKKLLTDNESIKEQKYYSTGFIDYSISFNDKDVEYILNEEKVDYSYKGDFSPERLIEHIENEYDGAGQCSEYISFSSRNQE